MTMGWFILQSSLALHVPCGLCGVLGRERELLVQYVTNLSHV